MPAWKKNRVQVVKDATEWVQLGRHCVRRRAIIEVMDNGEEVCVRVAGMDMPIRLGIADARAVLPALFPELTVD